MIVCLCNRVSDRDIQRAVQSGTHCFDTLCGETGVASCCGRCHDCAREVFDAAHGSCCGGACGGSAQHGHALAMAA